MAVVRRRFTLRLRLLLTSACCMIAVAGAVTALYGWQSGSDAAMRVGLPVATIAALVAAAASAEAVRSSIQPLEAVTEAVTSGVPAEAGRLAPRLPAGAAPELRALGELLDGAAENLRDASREVDRSRMAFRLAVTRLGDALASTHDRDGIIEVIVETVLLTVPADCAVYYRASENGDLEAAVARGIATTGLALGRGGLAGEAVRHDGPVVLGDGRGEFPRVAPSVLDPAEPPAAAGVATPLRSLGRLLGVVAVYGTSARRGFSDDEVAVFVSLVRQAEVAMTNIDLHEQAQRQALTDPLTGLWNRRQFDARLREAVAAANRYGEPFSVVMLDVDNFKRLNDTWDHLTGDAALVHVAGVLRAATRELDGLCRWGGEEFVVLLSRAGPGDATTVAERIVTMMRTVPFTRDGVRIPVTVSAGVATFPADGASGPEVVERADGALSRAKQLGKDRVERALLPVDPSTVIDITHDLRSP